MTSRPLLTRVAELMVMTGPMAQVGCARASSTVTCASCSFVRPRKGPPEAVTTSLRTSARVPAARHWKSAACSESTGMIWPGLASAFTSGPPTMSDSLLASARVRPASRAARVGARPMEPVMPFSTVWLSEAASWVAASGPARISGSGSAVPYSPLRASRRAGTASSRATATVRTRSRRACSARRAIRPPLADRPVTRKRSGLRSTRSMAWVPIDPVDPRTTTSLGPSPATGSKARCGSARRAGLSLIPPLLPQRTGAWTGCPPTAPSWGALGVLLGGQPWPGVPGVTRSCDGRSRVRTVPEWCRRSRGPRPRGRRCPAPATRRCPRGRP